MSEPELPEVVRQMLRPEFYPHPTTPPIQLLQTHISYVLLTGDFAYKVKKPVDLGFLDFSTLDRRRHFCSEELRLNRRGAPGLYLQVLPVTRADGRHRLGGTGEPVEYAVQMRQFPQEVLCRAMLEKGVLGEPEVGALAGAVVRYHADAATNSHIASFGAPERIGASIEQNFIATERFVGGAQTREQFDQTKAFTDHFIVEREEFLRRRAQTGRIRECHGDLHLNNICLWDGRVLLFDCIEFNEAFRFVDTAYDTAFTAMDFEARGRRDLATTFINGYYEQTGDWEGLRVLPLYLCRQAYVRAKVASILAEEVAADREAHRRASAEAAAYYRLAWRYTLPRRGRIILMSGLSGSGKTTIARAVATRLGAAHLRSDAVRRQLAGFPLEGRGPSQLYTDAVTRLTYERLIDTGTSLAADGYTVILDAKFDRVWQRFAAMDAARRLRLPFSILYCAAPNDVLRERLRNRGEDISDATAELLEQQARQWEAFTDAERPFVTALETRQPAEAAAEDVARMLTPCSAIREG